MTGHDIHLPNYGVLHKNRNKINYIHFYKLKISFFVKLENLKFKFYIISVNISNAVAYY